ncbi:MAG: hypothetical protein ACLUOI_34360 [Eisenbergiella sp.]
MSSIDLLKLQSLLDDHMLSFRDIMINPYQDGDIQMYYILDEYELEKCRAAAHIVNERDGFHFKPMQILL